ncbi:MAG: helix-turn-helix domain-containing protein [Chloroflexi bacterium]|nr:helix-turn-helix domain-containing protein [Chloroflexota bacterium]
MPESEALTLTIAEAARALGISRHLAYDLARRGRIPVLRLGDRRLAVPRAAFLDFLSGRWTPPEGTGHEHK